MKILAYQPLINHVKSVEEKCTHVRRMARSIEEYCRQESDIELILLPELSTIEYSTVSFDQLADFAEPLEGETFMVMSSLAKRVGSAVSYGFPRLKNGKYFISQVVVGSSGQLLSDYNKIHLAHFGVCREQDYFSQGDKLSIFNLGRFRFGVIICYDFRFSELIKQLAIKHEVEVILHPVAFAKDGSFASWHHFVITRALEYQVYFLSINRAGHEYGHSILCPPWIDGQKCPISIGEEKEVCIYTLDKQEIRIARETYPFRKDMLPDYSVLETGA